MGDNLIAWSSKKQHVVARSSTELEYRALASVASEITWIQSLFKELELPQVSTPILRCDKMSAGTLAANPVYYARTKHIELDIHFIRDKILAKELEVKYVPSSDQIIDLLTKGLTHLRFTFLKDKLGVTSVPSSLKGGMKN